MATRQAGGLEPPDSAGLTAFESWRIDYSNLSERRRERLRRQAGGASRDLGPNYAYYPECDGL